MIHRTNVVSVLAGLLLVAAAAAAAAEAPAWALLVGFGTVTTLTVFLAPRFAAVAFGFFLLLQPLLVNLVGGFPTPLGTALHRSHQIVAAAAAIRVGVFLGWRQLPVRLTPWVWPVALFLIAGLLSAVVHGVPVQLAGLGAFLSIKFPLFFLFTLTVEWRPTDARILIRGCFLLVFFILGLAIVWWLLPPGAMALFNEPGAAGEGFFARGELRPLQAPFTHPGTLGWLMAVGACYAIAQFTDRPSGLSVLAMLASVVGIVGSLRRKPLIALPIAVLAGGMAMGTKRQRWGILFLLATLVGGVVVFGRSQVKVVVSDAIAEYLDPYAPTTARALLYVTGWRIGVDRFPLGIGFSRYGGYVSALYYSPVYDEYGLSQVRGLSRDYPNYIQDTYWPHILGETGFVGVLALVVFFASVWFKVLRVTRGASDSSVRVLAFGAALALVEGVVESAVWPLFEVSLPAYTLAVSLGIAVVLGAQTPRALSSGGEGDRELHRTSPP